MTQREMEYEARDQAFFLYGRNMKPKFQCIFRAVEGCGYQQPARFAAMVVRAYYEIIEMAERWDSLRN